MSEDTILGATAINALLFSNHKNYQNSVNLDKLLSKHGISIAGKDSRGNRLWSRNAVAAKVQLIKESIEKQFAADDDTSPAENKKPTKNIDGALADLDFRIMTMLRAEIEDPMEKIGMMFLGNQEIFKAIAELRGYLTTRLDAIEKRQQYLMPIKPAADLTGATAEVSKRYTQPPADKKHVAIIGISPSSATQIGKDFPQEFNFTFVSPNEANKVRGLKSCDAIYTVRGGVMSRHIDLLKAMGKKHIEVSGMSNLRDALTSLYINSANNAAT